MFTRPCALSEAGCSISFEALSKKGAAAKFKQNLKVKFDSFFLVATTSSLWLLTDSVKRNPFYLTIA